MSWPRRTIVWPLQPPSPSQRHDGYWSTSVYTERFEFIGGATFDMGRATKAEVLGYVLDQLHVCEPVMVGDRFHDVQGSAAFDIPCIGVNWGYAGSGRALRCRGALGHRRTDTDFRHRASQAAHADQPVSTTEGIQGPMSSAPEGFRQHRFIAPPTATTVLLVRHGESAPAIAGKPFALVDGHGDPELHEEGHRQALKVAERLRNDAIAAIYVTTLTRTHQTAAPLAAALGLTPIVNADLREVFLGDWEGGLLRQKAAELDPIYLRVAAEKRWDIIPNAEPIQDFNLRTQRGLATIVANHPGQRVVAVVHGGVIGQIMNTATQCQTGAFNAADNASITELVVDGDTQVVRRYNDTAHLYG